MLKSDVIPSHFVTERTCWVKELIPCSKIGSDYMAVFVISFNVYLLDITMDST